MSRWDHAAEAINDAVNEVYAEAFDWIPQAQLTVNDGAMDDPTREGRTVMGIYCAPAYPQDLGARRRSVNILEGDSNLVAFASPRLSLDAREFPEGLPRRLDKFVRKATGEMFSAETVLADSQGRAIVMCAVVPQ